MAKSLFDIVIGTGALGLFLYILFRLWLHVTKTIDEDMLDELKKRRYDR